jgi:hypothetical protein
MRISGEINELLKIYNCAIETVRNESSLTDKTAVAIHISKQQHLVDD